MKPLFSKQSEYFEHEYDSHYKFLKIPKEPFYYHFPFRKKPYEPYFPFFALLYDTIMIQLNELFISCLFWSATSKLIPIFTHPSLSFSPQLSLQNLKLFIFVF